MQNNIIKLILNILLYIWELPQNIIGLILVLFYRPEKNPIKMDNGNIVYFSRYMPGGISLGKYSIINSYYAGYKTGDKKMKPIEDIICLDIVKHEAIGHGTQSRILGPLYLFVIGLPSLIWSKLYGAYIKESKNGYFKFYTERWADKLAGIIR